MAATWYVAGGVSWHAGRLQGRVWLNNGSLAAGSVRAWRVCRVQRQRQAMPAEMAVKPC